MSEYLRRKWKSWLMIVCLSSIGYYFIALHFDWWLFHFHKSRIARDANAVSRRIQASGLPFQRVGVVTYGDQSWPLEAVVLQRSRAMQRACIFAGIHGNEPAGTETALQFIEKLARKPGLYPQLNFVVMPLANPWGWAHDLRHNGNNLDIARNFQSEGTAETTAIKQLLKTYRCDLLVDLHEDRLRAGFYMLTYENADEQAVIKIAQAVKARGIALGGQGSSGFYHIPASEFSTVSRPTLSLFARQQGVLRSYIVETPMRESMSERVLLQRLSLDQFLQSLGPQV